MASNSEKLFGTDGVRGKANSYPITPEVALQLGKAIAHVLLAEDSASRRAVIGKDTRLSGYMLESAITSGLVSMGMHVYLVGPMPTPAVAHLTKSMGAAVGLMITASHNPAEDNGIKIFSGDGFKLSDDKQAKIEDLVLTQDIPSRHVPFDRIGKAYRVEDASGRYIEFAKSTVDNVSLSGLKLVLDCANGAAYFLGPLIFRELGAEVASLAVDPDGYNINMDSGVEHTERLCDAVMSLNADLGIALDGDADRAVFVDASGTAVHGDQVLGLLALGMKEQGQLRNDTIAVTIMSNIGLQKTMNANGIDIVTTPVGDRFVIDRMRKDGLSFGGEQSGHIIYMDHATTGDGIIAALQLVRQMRLSDQPFSALTDFVTIYPQKLVNINVLDKRNLDDVAAVQSVLAKCSAALGDGGRHLVRYSGTENKLRVMVEAQNTSDVEYWTGEIAIAVEQAMGGGGEKSGIG